VDFPKENVLCFFFSLLLPWTSFDLSLAFFFPLSVGETMLATHLLTTY
jgi:hypothetical protein